MKLSHDLLKREVTVEEARKLWAELGEALGLPRQAPPTLLDKVKEAERLQPQWPLNTPIWATPTTGTPTTPPWEITCERAQ